MPATFIQKREASTQLILQVGLELFAENGFQSTTIRMIAEKAGISLGLLYNYFKSKEEVLVAIFKKNTQDLISEFTRYKENEPKSTLSGFIRRFFKILKSNPNFWLLYYSVKLSRTTAVLVTEEIRELGIIQEMLEDYLMEAEISFPSLEAKYIWATLDGLAQHFFIQDNFPVNDLIHVLLIKYRYPNPR